MKCSSTCSAPPGGGFRVARPDGFRLDAVKHLPLEFWAKFNGSFDVMLLGELLDGDPGTVARTWREGKFTSMFDFPLGFAIADVFCRGESPAKLAAVLTNDRRYPDPSALVTLVDNHDLPRIMSQCGGDVEKVKQALAFLISMRGVPSIIWGTEVGFDGAKEPDNRKSMRFVTAPVKAQITSGLTQRSDNPSLRVTSRLSRRKRKMNKPFTLVAVVVFSIVALLQLLRLLLGWEITINAITIPLWASGVAFVVAAGLAAMVWRERRS